MEATQKFNARFPEKLYGAIQTAVKKRRAEPGMMKFSTNDWVVEAARRMLEGGGLGRKEVSLPEAVMDTEPAAEKGPAVLDSPVTAALNMIRVNEREKPAKKQPTAAGPKPFPANWNAMSNSDRNTWLRQNR